MERITIIGAGSWGSALARILGDNGHQVKLFDLDQKTIDEINILNATKKAMTEAVMKLKIKPEHLLIDAEKLNLDIPYTPIIKGDAFSISIAAASIIAKVTRDRMMQEYDAIYPGYNFTKNKGYGTKEHIEAIQKLGPSPIHRRSFIEGILNR